MSNTNIVQNKTDLLSSAGSFWRNMLINREDVKKVRRLARVTDLTSSILSPDRLGQMLSGGQFTDVNNVVVSIAGKTGSHSAEWNKRFLDSDNNPVRPLHDSITDAGVVEYSVFDARKILFDDGAYMSFPYATGMDWNKIKSVEPVFYTRCSNMYPFAIKSTKGVMVAGIDFEIQFDRILLKEDPKVIFPNDKMFVVAGKQFTNDTQAYVHGVQELKQAGYAISKYLRGQTSANVFEMALNEAASLTVVPKDFTVSHYTLLKEKGVIYKGIDGAELHILQPHKVKLPGETFTENEIPGKAIECHCYHKDGPMWWNKIRWAYNTEITGLTGIFDVRFYNSSIQLKREGSFVHILAKGKDSVAWNLFRQTNEAEYSTNLSSQLITEYSLAEGDEVTVTDLDFILEKLLTSSALVVTIDESKVFPDNRKNLYEFLEYNKPTGAVTILNIWPESN